MQKLQGIKCQIWRLKQSLLLLLLCCCFWLSHCSSSGGGAVNPCDESQQRPQWSLRSDQLTVLINGYAEARLPLLMSIARSYSASPLVHSIYILWGNTSTPSSLLLNTSHELLDLSLGSPIYLLPQHTSSLNARFLPRTFIRTSSVLICDDDVLLPLHDLRFAFRIWHHNQQRIVGFFPRSHEYHIKSLSWIYTLHPDKYSIMLTKSMILATHYLHAYTCRMPPAVLHYVDSHMNCEDIAMNFVVSNSSKLGPLLVGGTPRDYGDPRNSDYGDLTAYALSAKKQHRKKRGDCITDFHRLWGVMPLRYSYGKAIDAVEEQGLCEKQGSLVRCDE